MLIDIFVPIDDFCKLFEKEHGKHVLSDGVGKRDREMNMALSEVLTIMICAKQSGYKNFKTFFFQENEQLKKDFPGLVSYSRFVHLQKLAQLPLFVFIKLCCMVACNGKSYADSTPLKACHPNRRYSHKVMRKYAESGKTSTGWFYGTKLHFVINEYGEIINFILTPGNVSDNNHDLIISLCRTIYGKIFADKGYIMNKQFIDELKQLFAVEFITKKRKNMKKEVAINPIDFQYLKSRGVIESTINILKTQFDLEHTRHRSVTGFVNNVFTSLIAYFFKKNKPSININNIFLKDGCLHDQVLVRFA